LDTKPRDAFNRAYAPEVYKRYRHALEAQLGHFPFQVAETPLFISPRLRDQLAKEAVEITAQLSKPQLLEKMKGAIPDRYRAPGMDPLPNCVQVDFALCQGKDGELEGKVVELQAFPSGYAMMSFMADAWNETIREIPGLEGKWTCFINMKPKEALELMRRTILGFEKPEDTVLVDFEPELQKTSPDFIATKRLFGVEAVCATKLIKKGRQLFYEKNGKLQQVRRIYNRMVFDELEVKGYKLQWDFRDDLDITWCSHPNWYWVWSKYSLPFLDHPAVPKARFLSELDKVPEDLSGYVLKPLFSFAGSGVVIDVTPADVAKVPAEQRDKWVLQDKITYAPAFNAPDGAPVKAEIRVMLLRPPDSKELTPIIDLVRLSRGKMLGVDHNKGMTWVGGSVGIWRQEP
jgi:hypothetical protein